MVKLSFGPLLRQYIVVITVNLTVMISGLCAVWPSPVLVKLRNETETMLSHPITEEEGSWVVSIGLLTGLLPSFLAAYLVDKIGRKYCIIMACVPRILMGFLLIYATEVWMLLLSRAINGISDYFVFTVVPMYASEVASPEIRGALGTILQILCSVGVVIMLSMGPFISYVNLNIVFTCFAFATTVPLFFLPDSPYFLYSKGYYKKSLDALTFLRGSQVLAKKEMKEFASIDKKEKLNKRKLLTDGLFLKVLAIVIILFVGAQFIGFNAVNFYLQTILESTQTSVRPEIASVIIGFIQLFSSFCTVFLTDRFGRKCILICTLITMALGMAGLGTFFKLKDMGPIGGALNYIPLISLILVVFGFSAGLGSTVWVLTAELFDDSSRGVGLCTANVISFIALFVTSKYFPLMISVYGPSATYYFFTVNCILICLFITFCVPETKGKTFSEIQTALGAKTVVSEVKHNVIS